ncbi:MAG: Ldh family oxidoreductase [Stappiaceae bacterium]
MMSDTAIMQAEDARIFLNEIFTTLNLPAADAQAAADDLVLSNLWGVDSHGILRLPIYVERILNGAVNVNPQIKTIGGRGGFETMDGDSGLGYIIGHRAMDRAITLAGEHGISAVTVRNSNHFGAAGLFVKQATDTGMIALSMTNVGPNLVVPGGSKPITGNNPLAFGVPTDLDFPLILDISMSSVAGGKLLLAKEKGEKIPFGWATNKQGKPTDDPIEGFAGFLLPLGGHKGFGLSLMVDILCGVLSGGAFQFGLNSMYAKPEDPSNTGHLMLVIDPGAFLGTEAFLERMGAFCANIKGSPMWDDAARMLIPGELEYEMMQRRLKTGLPLPRSLLKDLTVIADTLNCTMPSVEYA